MDDQHPENPGGSGGDCVSDGPNTRETRLHERAIRERWPMGPAARVKVLKRLVSVVDPDYIHEHGGQPGHREAISAARAILTADKLNLEQDKLDFAREKDAREAGVDPNAPADERPRIVIPGSDDRS